MKALLVVLMLAGHVHHKPTAPVRIELTQRLLGGSDYEVTLTARPTRDVDSLELSLDGRVERVVRARANVVHKLTVKVHLTADAGREIVGGATVRIGNQRRNIAETVTLGKVPARMLPRSQIIVMPDGTRVEEVRP